MLLREQTEEGERRLGPKTGWTREGRTVVCRFGEGAVSLTILDVGTVRVRLARGGRFAERRSWAVTRHDEGYGAVDFEAYERDGAICLETSELRIELRDGGRLDIRDAVGNPVLLDAEDGGPSWSTGGSQASWTKLMPERERYYGFGERTGLLEKRGRRFTCWTTDEWQNQGPSTDALYMAIPFVLGLDEGGRSFGLFLDNTFRTTFDLGDLEGGTLTLSAEDGELGYYVFHGPAPTAVLERFTHLVGRMPLPPRWGLGYHQSRWGYASAEEVLAVARELRERRIPADAIHLDLDHMRGCRIFTWDPESFPDPAGLVRELRRLGLHAVTIVSAGVKHDPDGGYDVYDDGHARGMFLRLGREPEAEELTGYVWPGLCVFPDHVRPDVRAWWGTWYGRELDLGVSGFLNDMNEPAIHDKPYDEAKENCDPPDDLPHGPDDEPATHAEVRNLYAYLENLGTYEALCAVQGGERPFLLTRSGYAGVQRFAGAWTGDSTSLWEHLETSLPQLLNLGLSGVPFVGADIGGFFESCGPELLARWMQLGALTPLARNHSAKGTAPQEPWAWGEEVEKTSRRALELRYRLLPYLYSVFEEASRSGAPVLRPLFFHFPADAATHHVSDQALLGRDLMLAPVVRAGQEARAVYLPPGVWTDWRTGRRHEGGGWILASALLCEDLPLFARGGAIVPGGPLVQWEGEAPLDPLTLDVFPDAHGYAEGRLYEDDGRTFGYERGDSCTTTYVVRRRGGALVLTAARQGSFEPARRSVVVRLHGADGLHVDELPEDGTSWELTLG